MRLKRVIQNKVFSKIKIILLVLLWANGNAVAQMPERMIPDRPGFLTGTHTVTPGNLYLETGYQYSFNAQDAFRNFSDIPLVNIRFGLGTTTEMFVFWDGLNVGHKTHRPFATSSETEWNVPGIGLKQRIYTAEALSLTLMGVLEGSDESGTFKADPSLAILWELETDGILDFFGIAQLGRESEPESNLNNVVVGLGAAFAPGENTETFVEYYTIAYPEISEWYHGTEFGVMYFVSNNLQLDVYAGFSFGSKLFHYTGLGLARRF